ncbi:MAG: hypothetical protein NVS2B15_14860 [Pseudarthrobacter sp.]
MPAATRTGTSCPPKAPPWKGIRIGPRPACTARIEARLTIPANGAAEHPCDLPAVAPHCTASHCTVHNRLIAAPTSWRPSPAAVIPGGGGRTGAPAVTAGAS